MKKEPNLFAHRYIEVGGLSLPNKVAFEKLSYSIRPLGSFSRPYEGMEHLRAYSIDVLSGKRNRQAFYPTRTGSATLVSYRHRRFALFTRHQFRIIAGNNDLKEAIESLVIYIADDKETSNLPIEDLLFTEQESDDDLNDLVVAVIHDRVWVKRHYSFFFPIGIADNLPAATDLIAAGFTYRPGYNPISHALGVSDITAIAGKLNGYLRRQRDMVGHMHYEGDRGSLDGISGGGVYALTATRESFVLTFAGIVIRGGNGHIYFLNNARIVRILEDYLNGCELLGNLPSMD